MQMILSVAVPAPLYRLFDYRLPASTPRETDLLSGIIEDENGENSNSKSATQDFDKTFLENKASIIGRRVEIPFGHRKMIGIIADIKESDSDEDTKSLKSIFRFLDTAPSFNPQLVKLIIWASRYYCHPIGECFFTALPSPLRKHSNAIPEITIKKWYRTEKEFTHRANASKQIELINTLARHDGTLWDDQLKQMGFKSNTLTALEKTGHISKRIFDPLTAKHEQSQLANSQPATTAKNLNSEQKQALESILRTNFEFGASLLNGVTGSGKTEVYIAAATEALANNKQVLILIPEINLSSQTLLRFQQNLDIPIGLIHSGLGQKERTNTWLLAKQGAVKVIIGTRSAIFTPFDDLGLIIIDEEHDTSYKQNDHFKYSARDLAVKRAQLENCSVVLGSATPSLETLKNVQEGKYEHIKITSRAGQGSTPNIYVLDVRSRPLEHGCARPTLNKIEEELKAGNQVIVFQNRRGFSPTLICNACGWLMHCPNCDAKLTAHYSPQRMHCHHCDHKTAIPTSCPECTHTSLSPLGSGTERIELGLEQHLHKKGLEDFELWRFDRDNIRTDKELNKLIARVNSGRPGILIGTQMLVKGHDFHNVTLVCVVDADASFFSADYRAIERSAQQIIQVSGRTGRGNKSGTVIIQTKLPEHPIFDAITNSDYDSISLTELADREMCELPPYTKMVSIRSESDTLQHAHSALEELKVQALKLYQNDSSLLISGPVEASITKKAGIYRCYLHLFFSDMRIRQHCLDLIHHQLDQNRTHKARLFVDTDPSEYI